MKKFILIVISIIFLAFVSTTGYFVLSGNEKTYLVSQVWDGDTVELETGEWIRLLGINTPEKNESYYQQSKDRLKELIEGKKVRLESGPEDKDRYDRLLRYIFVDSTFVNVQLVKEGYATVFIVDPDEKYYFELKKAEKEAKDEQLGLWGKSSSDSCIQIKEFQYTGEEFVTFQNNCDYSIDLDGWKVKDEATHIYTFKKFVLNADSTFTLHTGSGKDTDTELYWNSGYVWNNAGDTLFLRDNNGGLVLTYPYP